MINSNTCAKSALVIIFRTSHVEISVNYMSIIINQCLNVCIIMWSFSARVTKHFVFEAS